MDIVVWAGVIVGFTLLQDIKGRRRINSMRIVERGVFFIRIFIIYLRDAALVIIHYNQLMSTHQSLAGVYAAALTPMLPDFSLAHDDLYELMEFLVNRGCHGALFFGTTGEGPSIAPEERLKMFRVAEEIRREFPGFRLLGGTGTPSLDETIELTKSAFDSGFDGVVVLPPYYYRNVSEEGLFAWFSQVISRAVPDKGALIGYHIPPISGVPLPLDLLARLKDKFPNRFAGIKDSSGDPEFARKLGERFGEDLLVFNGNDRLFSTALQNSASGCITALGNLCSPDLRKVWDANKNGSQHEEAQLRLKAAREISDKYPPAPPLIKYLISKKHNFNRWAVRPPLLPLTGEVEKQVTADIQASGITFN